MAIRWEIVDGESLLKIGLSFWIIDEKNNKSIDSSFHLEIKCSKLSKGKPKKSILQLETILSQRCPKLLKESIKRHDISFEEVKYLVANALFEKLVDADTIETDEERESRVKNKHEKIKDFFDSISDRLGS